MKDLLARRVPQAVGVYLGISWGLLQFLQYLVNRYGLSPHLESVTLTIAASLVPSVILFAYYHGRPGKDRWHKVELVGIPINLLVTVSLLFIFFQGKSFGATTETVKVRDEDGNQVEKLVAKREFRKSMALFPFTDTTEKPTLDWLGWGLILAMDFDLEQDLFLSVSGPPTSDLLVEEMRKAKTPLTQPFPFALCHRFAEKAHMDTFMTGSYVREGTGFRITTNLYDTRRGAKLATRVVSGEDAFALVDRLSSYLKQDLDLPAVHREAAKDLPIAEMFTANLESLKHIAIGNIALIGEKDINLAITHHQKAIDADPTNAYAYLNLAGLQVNANLYEAARKSLEAASRLDYKLPDRQRFQLRDFSYIINGQAEKRLQLLKMQTELYPDSIPAHLALANLYFMINKFEEAKKAYELAIAMAPEPAVYYHDLARIHERMGEDERALAYLEDYASEFPENAAGAVWLANYYLRHGAFEDARTHFEKAAILDPNPLTKMQIATIDIRLGHFEKGLNQYLELLNEAEDNDRVRVFEELEEHYLNLGQIGKVAEILESKMKYARESLPPMNVSFKYINDIGSYIRIGQKEKAFTILKQLEKDMRSPFEAAPQIGYVIAFIQLEDPVKTREHLELVKENLDSLAKVFNGVTSFMLYAEGRLLELEGKLEEALDYYGEFLALSPNDTNSLWLKAKCHRKLGRFREAEAMLLKSIQLDPYNARLHNELARVYEGMGQPQKAKAHLAKCLDIWNHADPAFQDAIEARQRAKKVEGA